MQKQKYKVMCEKKLFKIQKNDYYVKVNILIRLKSIRFRIPLTHVFASAYFNFKRKLIINCGFVYT